MKKMLLCLLFLPLVAFAEGSWQGIPFGSTAEEILEKGKAMGVEELPHTVDLSKNPSYRSLGINSYKIGIYEYKVRFLISSKTMGLVSVKVEAEQPTVFAPSMNDRYESVRQGLTEKYGQPIFVSRKPEIKQVWNSAEAKITLSRFDLKSMLSVNILIEYESPNSDSNSKL